MGELHRLPSSLTLWNKYIFLEICSSEGKAEALKHVDVLVQVLGSLLLCSHTSLGPGHIWIPHSRADDELNVKLCVMIADDWSSLSSLGVVVDVGGLIPDWKKRSMAFPWKNSTWLIVEIVTNKPAVASVLSSNRLYDKLVWLWAPAVLMGLISEVFRLWEAVQIRTPEVWSDLTVDSTHAAAPRNILLLLIWGDSVWMKSSPFSYYFNVLEGAQMVGTVAW